MATEKIMQESSGVVINTKYFGMLILLKITEMEVASEDQPMSKLKRAIPLSPLIDFCLAYS